MLGLKHRAHAADTDKAQHAISRVVAKFHGQFRRDGIKRPGRGVFREPHQRVVRQPQHRGGTLVAFRQMGLDRLAFRPG